jgi:hypothetical protein
MSGREDQEIGDESSAEGRAEDACLRCAAEAPGAAGSTGGKAMLPALIPAASKFRTEPIDKSTAGRVPLSCALDWAAAGPPAPRQDGGGRRGLQ